MAGRAKENLPGGSLKYLFVYLKVRIFKCSYRKNLFFSKELISLSPKRGSFLQNYIVLRVSKYGVDFC